MNHLPSIPETPDPFDRLVDGELSESERRELLASLDQEPDGWRRCALAFLETQCLQQELGDLRQTLPAGSSAVAPNKQYKKRSSLPFGLPGTLVAMAACFFLVLSAGILWQRSGYVPGNILNTIGSDQIAGNKADRSATTPKDAQMAVAQDAPQSKNTSASWQWVRLSPTGPNGTEQAVQVPAVQRDHIDEQWLRSLPSPIPDNIVQALQRGGYELQTQQELMPMQLKDGRRLVVPVDKVNVHYVGNQTY